MKFNSLGEALRKAEQANPVLPLPITPPKPAPPPSPPSYPPLRRVEGGQILRTPVNKQAAMLIAPAPWWALPPYEADKTPKKTVPEVEAELRRAVEWIRKLEAINRKLRDQLKQQQNTHQQALTQLASSNEKLVSTNQNLQAQIDILKEQLKIAELWRPA